MPMLPSSAISYLSNSDD